MLWQFKQSEDHKPTAKVARALEALDDHVFRQGPMDEKTLSEHHRTLHEAYQDLDPEDRAHVKMRLGMIGHQHALAEHEKREAEANASPDAAAEMAKLQAEIAALRRKNAELSAPKRG
jgi:hypothetical protein